MSSAKFLICFHFLRASMSLKVGENVVWVSNSLDLGETPSYLTSHPDPSCLHDTLVVIGRVRVKPFTAEWDKSTVESSYLEFRYFEFLETRSVYLIKKYILIAFSNLNLALDTFLQVQIALRVIWTCKNSPIIFEISRVDCSIYKLRSRS